MVGSSSSINRSITMETQITTEIKDKLRDNVARGVALLNRIMPGWHKKITDPLDMEGCHSCILGQLFNTYNNGVSFLIANETGNSKLQYVGTFEQWIINHGFITPRVGPQKLMYKFLGDVWMQTIKYGAP